MEKNVTYSGYFEVLDKDEKRKKRTIEEMYYCDYFMSTRFSKDVDRITTPIYISKPGEDNRYLINALWNTDAKNSVISEKYAKVLDLEAIEEGIRFSATDSMKVSYYLCDVILVDSMKISNLKISALPLPNHDVDFLIGMDIIKRGKFTIDYIGGQIVFTFDMR